MSVKRKRTKRTAGDIYVNLPHRVRRRTDGVVRKAVSKVKPHRERGSIYIKDRARQLGRDLVFGTKQFVRGSKKKRRVATQK